MARATARLVTMDRAPVHAAGFDADDFDPRAAGRTIPGLVRPEVDDGAVSSAGGASPYRVVATLGFGAMSAFRQGTRSPHGRAAGADAAAFAEAARTC